MNPDTIAIIRDGGFGVGIFVGIWMVRKLIVTMQANGNGRCVAEDTVQRVNEHLVADKEAMEGLCHSIDRSTMTIARNSEIQAETTRALLALVKSKLEDKEEPR